MVDIVAMNGTIRTQDSSKPVAEAIAVKGTHIVAVGPSDEIRELATPSTTLIDLGGRLVLPGFTDCHFHFYDWALGRSWLDLKETDSLENLLAILRSAGKNPSGPDGYGKWILGQNWDESRWPEKRMPSKKDLDKVTGGRPAMLWRSDLHLAVANSNALQLAGITEYTSDPDHGIIGRDTTGHPNGVLQDRAIDLVKKHVPVPTDFQTAEAMAAALPVLSSMGLTGFHDFRLMDGHEGAPCLRALQQLHERRDLHLRVWMCLPSACIEDAIHIGLRTGMGEDFLRIGHVKAFVDGSLGARTAWLMEPYPDGHQGIQLLPMEDIHHLIKRAESYGLSVAVHAIGDRAIHELISLFSGIEKERPAENQPPELKVPHRIEHLQLMHIEDIDSLSRLKVVGSVQPRQATDDISLTREEIGGREKLAYRFRDMLDRGIILGFGSNCPVANPNPLNGIHAAVTRQREDGTPKNGWFPEQRITVEEAVRAYTLGAAEVAGRQDTLGTLSPGKLADFIVLERDIHAINPSQILETRIDVTCVGGEIIYDRNAEAS